MFGYNDMKKSKLDESKTKYIVFRDDGIFRFCMTGTGNMVHFAESFNVDKAVKDKVSK